MPNHLHIICDSTVHYDVSLLQCFPTTTWIGLTVLITRLRGRVNDHCLQNLRPQCCSGDVGASISPPDDMKFVWTCGVCLLYLPSTFHVLTFSMKYELDSLLSFLQLSRLYYEYSKDESIFVYDNHSCVSFRLSLARRSWWKFIVASCQGSKLLRLFSR